MGGCYSRDVWAGSGWDYYKCKCCGCGCCKYTKHGGGDSDILPDMPGGCCKGNRGGGHGRGGCCGCCKK